MARDPWGMIAQNNQNMQQAGMNDQNDAQNTLQRMFMTEAARQEPYVKLPAQLAYANQTTQGYADLARTKAGLKTGKAIAPGKAGNMVKQLAQQFGVDPDEALAFAAIESGFNPGARNASGATGILQFMPKTAQQYGIDPTDVGQSMQGYVQLQRDNTKVLESNGIPATPATRYLAWQQGAGNAVKLLSNPDAPAEQIVGRAALLQNGGRIGMSAKMFADMWMNKMERTYAGYAQNRERNRKPKEATGLAALGVGSNAVDPKGALSGKMDADVKSVFDDDEGAV